MGEEDLKALTRCTKRKEFLLRLAVYIMEKRSMKMLGDIHKKEQELLTGKIVCELKEMVLFLKRE